MPQVTIHVPPRPYQARIENGLLTRAGSVLSELLPQASQIFVVTVPPVRKRWGTKLVRSLTSSGFKPQVIPMPDGEPSKRLATVEALSEKLARRGADRKAVIIALGGGVVGDVSGLLASLYMRGIELVQIPTTVLAQVDASIGGKTAVNLVAGKNMLGTFHHPRVEPGSHDWTRARGGNWLPALATRRSGCLGDDCSDEHCAARGPHRQCHC